jgi:diphthamide biosynthesis methyltransferase
MSQSTLSFLQNDQCQNLISIKTKRHKSLGVLTLIFIEVFLRKGPMMSLDDAADNIFEENEDGSTLFKSKVTLP